MKVKKKCVYYCDFCSKKSLRSLKIHEKHCTANPDRECRLCDNKSIKPIIEKYRKYFTIEETEKAIFGEREVAIKPIFKKEFTLKDIINELDYICPNCIFAIIRCLGLNRYYMGDKFKYNYKEELDKWWAIVNEEARRKDEHDSIYY